MGGGAHTVCPYMDAPSEKPDTSSSLFSPVASIRLGFSGEHNTSLQLANKLPALNGLKLAWVRLLEYDPFISSLVVRFAELRYYKHKILMISTTFLIVGQYKCCILYHKIGELLTVWNPANPRMLHMLKKHITHTTIDPGDSRNASTKAWFPPEIRKMIMNIEM